MSEKDLEPPVTSQRRRHRSVTVVRVATPGLRPPHRDLSGVGSFPAQPRLDLPRGPDDAVAARPCPDSRARLRRGPGRREALRPGAAHSLERLARGRLARPAAALQGRAGLSEADNQAAPEPDPRAGDQPPVRPSTPQLLGRAGPPARRPTTIRTRPRPRPCSRSTASPSAWPSTPTTNATATSISD